MVSRKNLEEKLKKRGWISFDNGETAHPPKYPEYSTKTEIIIDLLCDSLSPLTNKDIAGYLCWNAKNVGKIMRTLLSKPNAKRYISKLQVGRAVTYYCNPPDGIDVKTLYKIIKTEENPTEEIKPASVEEANIITPDILELVKSGELEIVIRRRQ